MEPGYRASGKVPLAALPAFAAALALGTITLCYFLAVNEGHVKPWPYTDITHCGVDAPERYLFRMGMIPASVLMSFLWSKARDVIHGMDPSHNNQHCPFSLEGVASFLGIVGGICLVISCSVLEQSGTPWTLHIGMAMAFFILTVIGEILYTIKLINLRLKGVQSPALSNSALAIKIGLNVAAVALGAIDGLLELAHGPEQYENAIEWFEMGITVLYALTLSYDWSGHVYGTTVLTNASTNGKDNASSNEVEKPSTTIV